VVVLLAEDNMADQEIARRAMAEHEMKVNLLIVNDGVEAINYLTRRGKFSSHEAAPRPDIILLDINMPMMDGIQTLREIKENPDLKPIPVIMLTTSNLERDVESSYNLGANAYITKPMDFNMFSHVLSEIKMFWLKTATLPSIRPDEVIGEEWS